MRYAGQSHEITIPCPPLGEGVARAAASRFHRAHRQRFDYGDPGQPVEVVTARLKAVGLVAKPGFPPVEMGPEDPGGGLVDERPVVFGGRAVATRCYERERLRPGNRLRGPALVFQMDATTVVPPGWGASVDAYGNLVMEPANAA